MMARLVLVLCLVCTVLRSFAIIVPVPAGAGILEKVLSSTLPPGAILQLAAGEHVVEAEEGINLNATHSGITIIGPREGTAVISGATRIHSSHWQELENGLWAVNLQKILGLKENQSLPRQLWIGKNVSSAARRTRARHPNLFLSTSTGLQIQEFPYMYWASPLYIDHSLPHACQHGKKCNALGCNETGHCDARTDSSGREAVVIVTFKFIFWTSMSRIRMRLPYLHFSDSNYAHNRSVQHFCQQK